MLLPTIKTALSYGRKFMVSFNPFLAHPFKAVLFPLSASLFLWGCAAKEIYEFAPGCPKITVLSSAADYYTFANQQTDIAHLMTKASIIGVGGECLDDPHNAKNKKKREKGLPYQNKINTDMNIVMQIQRGPAASENHIRVPYFIATLHDGNIEDKQEMSAEVTFPNNVNQIIFRSDKLRFNIPSTPQRTADNYELVIGFQLSPEQLEYNRSHYRSAKFRKN